MKQLKNTLLAGAVAGSLMLVGCAGPSGDYSNRSRSLNEGWKFTRDTLVGAEAVGFDDTNWLSVDLPHDFSIMNIADVDGEDHIGPFTKQSEGGNSTGHVKGGTGWYRKSFTLSKEDEGKSVSLLFDGVYMESDVWVNGKHVGSHKNGYTPFYYDITSVLKPVGEVNELAVKVVNEGRNSRWYSGSGIYRDVKLVVTHPVHVAMWGCYVTTPAVDESEAAVDMKVTVNNDSGQNTDVDVYISILNKDGKEVAKTDGKIELIAHGIGNIRQQIKVQKPDLWSMDRPNLYTLEVRLKQNDQLVDMYKQTFGIRSVVATAEKGLLLNGQPVLLRGGCVHHDNGLLGSAAYKDAEYRKVKLLKENGYNAIRCSHNPPSEYFLNACDELGMLVIDEFTDMWTAHKNPQDYSRFFEKYWENDLTDMMTRDRNHPSIIMWSIGNEIPNHTQEEAAKTGKMLADKVRLLDPSRLVTQAITGFMAPGGWEKTGSSFEVLDVCGYNYMIRKYESDHEKYPERVIYCSESYPNQAYDYWKAVETHPYVIGDFVWTAMDYIGEVAVADATYGKELDTRALQAMSSDVLPANFDPTKIFDVLAMMQQPSWPKYLAWCGDLDIIGQKKPQSYFRDVIWDKAAVSMNVHEPIPDGMVENESLWGWPREFHHWNWKGNEGKSLQVRAFTKGDKVVLYLNGKQVGESNLTEVDKCMAIFMVPYESGVLEAAAYRNGQEIGRTQLVTAGEPASIRLLSDKTVLTADRSSLAYVTIEVVDKDGNVVPHLSQEIELSLKGAELAGCGNGHDDMKSFNHRRLMTYNGKALAIIRPLTASKGTIDLVVQSDGLSQGTLSIPVK